MLRSKYSAISSTYCLSYLLFRIEAIAHLNHSIFARIADLDSKIQFLILFFCIQHQKSDLSPSSFWNRSETCEFPASPRARDWKGCAKRKSVAVRRTGGEAAALESAVPRLKRKATVNERPSREAPAKEVFNSKSISKIKGDL